MTNRTRDRLGRAIIAATCAAVVVCAVAMSKMPTRRENRAQAQETALNDAPTEPPLQTPEAAEATVAIFATVAPPPASAKIILPPPAICPEAEPTEPEPVETDRPYTDEELEAIARTLAGECYESETADKYAVAWVILNRVTDGRFGGDTVLAVVSSKQFGTQFAGYWKQAREISESDYAIAAEALTAWHNGEPPIHSYLYFSSGKGRVNVYR